jgi:phospholipase D1/2
VLTDPSSETGGASPRARLIRIGIAIVCLLWLAAAWRWTPLKTFLNPDRISAWAAPWRTEWFAPLLTMAAFVVGGFLMVPVLLLILVCGLAFGPLLGSIYAIAGCLASGAAAYAVGHVVGHATLARFAAESVKRLDRRLAKRGIMTIFVMRKIPVAPYTLVNLVAGASAISFRDFMIGTLLGMGPGVIAINVFGHQIANVMRHPEPGTIAIAAGVLAMLIGAALLLQRLLDRRQD